MGVARSKPLTLARSPAIARHAVAGVCFLVILIGAQACRARAQTSGAREHYEAGINAYQRGDLHLAEREFRAVLKLQPGLLEARENLGVTLGRLGELEAAVAELRKVLAARPNSAETHYNLGLVLLQKKDRGSSALREFRRAVELRPDYPEAQNNLGLLEEEAGDITGAHKAFEEAVHRQPHY